MDVFDIISKIIRCVCPLELALWLMRRHTPWSIHGSFIDTHNQVIFKTAKAHDLGCGIWLFYDLESDIKERISDLEWELEEERKKLRSVMDKDEDDDDDYY